MAIENEQCENLAQDVHQSPTKLLQEAINSYKDDFSRSQRTTGSDMTGLPPVTFNYDHSQRTAEHIAFLLPEDQQSQQTKPAENATGAGKDNKNTPANDPVKDTLKKFENTLKKVDEYQEEAERALAQKLKESANNVKKAVQSEIKQAPDQLKNAQNELMKVPAKVIKAEQELMAAPKVFVDFFKEVKRGYDLDRERERQNKGK